MPEQERVPLRKPGPEPLRGINTENLERFGLDRLLLLATREQEMKFLQAAEAYGAMTSTQADRHLLERVLGKLPRLIRPEDLTGICGESPAGLFQVTTVGEIVRFLTREFGVSFALSEGITTDILGIQPEKKKRRDKNPHRWKAEAIWAGRREGKVMARLGPEAGTPYYSVPPSRDVDIVTLGAIGLWNIFEALKRRPRRKFTLISERESARRKFPYITIIPSGESSRKTLLAQIHYLESRGLYAPGNSLLNFALCRGTFRSLLILLVPAYHRELGALSGVVVDPLGALDYANCVSVGDQNYSLDVFPFFERAFPMDNPSQALASLLHVRRSEAWSNGIPIAFHKTLPEKVSVDWTIENWRGLAHIFAYCAYHKVIKPIAENPEIIENEPYRARSAIDLVQELFVSSLNGDPAGTFICFLAPGTHRDDISPHYGHGFIELFPVLSGFLAAVDPKTGSTHQENLLVNLSRVNAEDPIGGSEVFFDYLISRLSPEGVLESLKPSLYPYSTAQFAAEAEDEPGLRRVFKKIRPLLGDQNARKETVSLTAPETQIVATLASLDCPPSSTVLLKLAGLPGRPYVLRRLLAKGQIFYLGEGTGINLVATKSLLERFKMAVGDRPRTTQELAKLLGLPPGRAFSLLQKYEIVGLIRQLGHRKIEEDRVRRTGRALWGLPDTPPPQSYAEVVLEAVRRGCQTISAIRGVTNLKDGTIRAILIRLEGEGLVRITRKERERANSSSLFISPTVTVSGE